MKKLLAILFSLIMLMQIAFAAETVEVPAESITPDSKLFNTVPVYWAKQAYEGAEGVVYTIQGKQAEHFMLKAQRRLGELKSLPEGTRAKYAEVLMQQYNQAIEKALDYSSKIDSLEKRAEAQSRVQNMTAKHLDVLEDVLKDAPDESKNGIRNAIQVAEDAKELSRDRLARTIKAQKELED